MGFWDVVEFSFSGQSIIALIWQLTVERGIVHYNVLFSDPAHSQSTSVFLPPVSNQATAHTQTA